MRMRLGVLGVKNSDACYVYLENKGSCDDVSPISFLVEELNGEGVGRVRLIHEKVEPRGHARLSGLA